jgi:hypothetical protein
METTTGLTIVTVGHFLAAKYAKKNPLQNVNADRMFSSGEIGYIRLRYDVPAKRGMLVYNRDNGFGHILSARNGLLHIRTDNGAFWFHPTDVQYCNIPCPECKGSGLCAGPDGYDDCYLCEGYGMVDKDAHSISWDCTVGEWLAKQEQKS